MAWYDSPIPTGGNVPIAGGWMDVPSAQDAMQPLPQLPSNQWPLAYPTGQTPFTPGPPEPPPKLWTMVEQRLKDILTQDQRPYYTQPQNPLEKAQNEATLAFMAPGAYAAQLSQVKAEDRTALQEAAAKEKKIIGVHGRIQALQKRMDAFQKNKAPEEIRKQTENQYNALIDQLETLDPDSQGMYDKFSGEGQLELKVTKEARDAKWNERKKMFEDFVVTFGEGLGRLVAAEAFLPQAFPDKGKQDEVRQEILERAPNADPKERAKAAVEVFSERLQDKELKPAEKSVLQQFVESNRQYVDQLSENPKPGAIYQDLMARIMRQLGKTWVKKPELAPMESQPFMGPSTTRPVMRYPSSPNLRRMEQVPWEAEEEPGLPPWSRQPQQRTLEQMVR